nr:AsmA-like C-terminal region-containing protein [Pirellula sp.]
NVYTKAEGGQWQHPQLSYPLDKVSGEIFLKKDDLRVRNVRALCGSSVLTASIDMQGLKMPAPMTAVVELNDLELDHRLFQSLPTQMQEMWNRFQARGHVDAKAMVRFDGQTWHPYVEVLTEDLSINAEFFPYPLTNIGGKIIYNDGKLIANNMSASAGEQTLSGSLELTKASPKWLMDFQFTSDGPVAIDKNLLNALTPRTQTTPSGFQKFVDSLHPNGTVHLKHARFQRSPEDPSRINRSLELIFSECSLKYDQFRYPIDNVHGEITVDNDRIIVRDFIGRNDATRIKAYGLCQLDAGQLDSVDLVFDTYDLAMDEELRNALTKGVQSLWDEIQPVGMMGHAKVELVKRSRNEPLDLRVEMKKDSVKDEGVGRSLAFRPRSLPYSINDVSCHVAYSPGRIDILSLTGTHDASRLNAEGHYRIYTDGSWDGTILWIPSTRFLVDQTLLACLPPYLRDPLLRLDFRGPVSISGSTFVSSPKNPNDSVVRSWDIDLEIEDGRLGGGGIASGMRGTISMAGENTASGPMAYGTLEFDALAVKSIPVIGLTGPFALTNQDLLFGRDAVTWQEKYVVQKQAALDKLRQNDVSLAVAYSDRQAMGQTIGQATGKGDVTQASFRNTIHDRLDARFVKLSQTSLGQKSMVKKGNLVDGPELDVTAHDVTAETLSGKLYVSGVEPLDGRRARYQVRLVEANLKDCLLDLGEPNPQTNGKLWMQCDLAGSFTNMSSLEGKGNVWLRNANLYQLPIMIRLFNLLSVRPDQSAFDAVDIRFGIDGDRIPIEDLSLDGNLVSLRGSGWVNMRRALHLNLDANVSRRTIVGAVMRPLQREYPSNLFRIEVTGTTTDPIVRSNVALMGQMQRPNALEMGGASSR